VVRAIHELPLPDKKWDSDEFRYQKIRAFWFCKNQNIMVDFLKGKNKLLK